MSVDLYLGSDIGLWVLTRVAPIEVNRVVSPNSDILSYADDHGFNTHYSTTTPTALSVHFPHVFSPEEIATYDAMYNLHPSYLPWGRGYYPMFWSLYRGEPAGATLHQIDAGIDTGPIVDQIAIPTYIKDDGDHLYSIVRMVEKVLFNRWWSKIVYDGVLPTRPQEGKGSYHSKKDFDRILERKGNLWQVQRCLVSSMSGNPISPTIHA